MVRICSKWSIVLVNFWQVYFINKCYFRFKLKLERKPKHIVVRRCVLCAIFFDLVPMKYFIEKIDNNFECNQFHRGNFVTQKILSGRNFHYFKLEIRCGKKQARMVVILFIDQVIKRQNIIRHHMFISNDTILSKSSLEYRKRHHKHPPLWWQPIETI